MNLGQQRMKRRLHPSVRMLDRQSFNTTSSLIVNSFPLPSTQQRPPSPPVDGMDVVLGITDGRRGALEPLLTAIGAAAEPVPFVCVINKVDVLGPRAVSCVVTRLTLPEVPSETPIQRNLPR